MNLTRLRYFIAVAESQNVVKAARALNVAQPALSRQLKALENEVGAPLLERHPRGVRLTAAGSALLTHAREAVGAAAAGIAAARMATEASVVNVSPPDWPRQRELIVAAVAELSQSRPEIEVVYNVEPWTVSVSSLRAGVIDLGFGISASADLFDADIVAELLVREPGMSALISSRHPLASQSSVRLIDLRDVPALIPPREQVGALHDQMAALIRSGGYEPKIVAAPLSYSAATQMVAIGAGWVISIDSAADLAPPGAVVIPIEDAKLEVGFYALRRAGDERPAVNALVDALQAIATELSSAYWQPHER